MSSKLKFVQFVKSSMIDFEPYLSLVLFTPGCPLRCPYCFNKSVVLNKTNEVLYPEDVFDYLDGYGDDEGGTLIEAIVLSGGEPLLFAEEFPPFLKKLKERGLKIKVDTTLYGGNISNIMPYIDGVSISLKADRNLFLLIKDQFKKVNYSRLLHKELRIILTKENIEGIKKNYLDLVKDKDVFNAKAWYLHIDKAIKAEDYFGEFTELNQQEIEDLITGWPLKHEFNKLI